MAKFNDELVDKIVSLVEEDTYSITEICDMLNIGRKTYYRWIGEKTDFREAVEAATERRNEKLKKDARRSLRKKIEGYTLVEERITYVPDEDDPSQLKIKTHVVRKKEYAPDTSAIKLALFGSEKGKEVEQQNFPLNINVISQQAKDEIDFLTQLLTQKRDK
ncbi:MAG: phBC6A51 family helix-turn-helix protein [Dysgonomonas sp.]|nr:phBC6A51 family helix-turn-helix protein [Dysgonomonas sp.]